MAHTQICFYFWLIDFDVLAPQQVWTTGYVLVSAGESTEHSQSISSYSTVVYPTVEAMIAHINPQHFFSHGLAFLAHRA